jgi:methylenetetrahydrofolate dehydrogenase (NADP+)/methenyltetrahydrofolate cyclohydrolase
MEFVLHNFDENISENDILSTVEKLNNDEKVSGFIIQLPLPKHFDEQKIIRSINPAKDVDGFHPVNQGKIVIGDST